MVKWVIHTHPSSSTCSKTSERASFVGMSRINQHVRDVECDKV